MNGAHTLLNPESREKHLFNRANSEWQTLTFLDLEVIRINQGSVAASTRAVSLFAQGIEVASA